MFKLIAVVIAMMNGQPVEEPQTFTWGRGGAPIVFESLEACEEVRNSDSNKDGVAGLLSALQEDNPDVSFLVDTKCVDLDA